MVQYSLQYIFAIFYKIVICGKKMASIAAGVIQRDAALTFSEVVQFLYVVMYNISRQSLYKIQDSLFQARSP